MSGRSLAIELLLLFGFLCGGLLRLLRFLGHVPSVRSQRRSIQCRRESACTEKAYHQICKIDIEAPCSPPPASNCVVCLAKNDAWDRWTVPHVSSREGCPLASMSRNDLR